LWLYARVRTEAFPVDRSSFGTAGADAAIELARSRVEDLSGIDVRGWRAIAAVWSEEELRDRLHRSGNLERAQPLLRRWGLLGGWRVRFTSPRGTVLVGLAPGGELVALELEGPVEFHPRSSHRDAGLQTRLNGAPEGVWHAARAVGTGTSETADGHEEQIAWFVDEHEQLLRLTATVKTIDGAVTRVTCGHEVLGTDAARDARADAAETVAGLGGMLSSVAAAGAGVAFLATTDAQVDVQLALVLAGVVIVATLLGEPGDLRYTALNAKQYGLSWRTFRLVNLLTAVLTGAVMATVVAVAALAGSAAAQLAGLDLIGDPWRQLAWGGWLGALWLCAVAMAYLWLRRMELARFSPAPGGKLLRASGGAWPHALSISLQSSVGEETVFRLLGLAILLELSGSVAVAVTVTAVLWAMLHSGTAVRPRWTRAVELTLVGCALGVAVVEIGFLSALVAHAAYNLISTTAPLMSRERPRRASRRGGARVVGLEDLSRRSA
jgi:hypothetical protein